MSEHSEATSQRTPDVACPNNPDFHFSIPIQFVSDRAFFDARVRWNLPPLRVREIFRYPKRDNLPVTLRGMREASRSAGDKSKRAFDSSQAFKVSPFLRHLGDSMTVPLGPAAAVRESLVWLARVARS